MVNHQDSTKKSTTKFVFLLAVLLLSWHVVLLGRNNKQEVALSPISSLGEISEAQKRMVYNHLQSHLSQYYQLVSQKRFGDAQEMAYRVLDYEECTEAQCAFKILQILKVDQMFSLQMIQEGKFIQLTFYHTTLKNRQVATKLCDTCDVTQLNQLVEHLVAQLLPESVVAISTTFPTTSTSTTNTLPTLSTPTLKKKENSRNYITVGTHKDDVIRLQGTPSEIKNYRPLGYQVWHYGGSDITISSSTGRVLEWDNSDKNLKVRLRPGDNVSNTSYITVGTHKDDVIRLQGTPSEINNNRPLGYQVWHYGYSKIKISSSTGQVIEWNNYDKNLKLR